MRFINYGISRYTVALLEMELAKECVASGAAESVFITEHYAVCSAGKSSQKSDFLNISGIPIYYSSRGGRVTIHSPGQLVIYPIIDIKSRGISISMYVKQLEEWIKTVLRMFGINPLQKCSEIGVWVGDAKIGFVGIRVSGGITSHGLCLNISNDVSLFKSIVPCGLEGMQITSMEKILNRQIPLDDIASLFKKAVPFS
jgi:lipoyl(octanoyl) transferase